MDNRADNLPVGETVAFTGARPPQRIEHRGRHVVLRPTQPDSDAPALYRVSHAPAGDPSIWTYLPEGPYADRESFQRALETQAVSLDPLFFTIARASDCEPLGILSYLAIVPEHGTIEIGHVWFSPQLKRTAAATEAIFLLAKHAFDELGYRRLEWKCDALNSLSRNAALRYGFQFEGVFLNHRVVKGRNRDTAWFAITDTRWPALRAAFESWLNPDNFDANGQQLARLSELTAN